MIITKYGIGIVVGSWIVFLVFLFLSLWAKHPVIIFLTTIIGLFSVFNLFFFRDPARTIPQDPKAILSPADGKVVQIVEIEEPDFFGKKVTRVSIFLSVFNVHVNRVPVTGKVAYFNYIRGKFFAAFEEKASTSNEQTVIGIVTPQGHKVMFKQIAGLIARRIVCELREGNQVKAGEIMGMIRYGSRADVYFDSDICRIKVKLGDKVKGGESIIGEFK